MNELEKIQELREKDEEETIQRLIEQQIVSAASQLHALEEEQIKLKKKLNQMNKYMAELEEENNRLGDEYCAPAFNYDPNATFFEQMKVVESEEEHLKGQLEGLRSVKNRLSMEYNTVDAKVKRLNSQLNELKNQQSAIETDWHHNQGTLAQNRAKLAELDSEHEQLTTECQDIKKAIKKKAEKLRGVSVDSISTLITQKAVLEKELRERKDEIKKLQNQEKDLRIKLSASSKNCKKETEDVASPMKWMSQRTSLMSKVSKARQELSLLNNRQRGATRSASRAQQIKEENIISDDDIKLALACEIAEVKKAPPKFMGLAKSTEETFAEEMKEQLAELERISKQILAHKQSDMEMWQDQEYLASRNERINLLKKELAELRNQI